MNSKSIYLSILTVLSSLIIIPLVSANATLDFFANDWIKFAISFAILFAVMFSFFKPKFNYSSAPTAVVSGGLSILLTIAITRRGILDALVSPEIVDWIVTGAIILAIIFLIFWFWKKFRLKGFLGVILVLAIASMYLEDYIPETLLYGPLGTFIEWLQAMPAIIGTGLVILLAVLLVWWLIARKIGYNKVGKEEYYKQKGKQRAIGGQQTNPQARQPKRGFFKWNSKIKRGRRIHKVWKREKDLNNRWRLE